MDLRIDVTADDTISAQARTYAEYRVFAALSRLPHAVFEARVLLRSTTRSTPRPGVSCTVTVIVPTGDSLRVSARGAHAYAAINRAVERMRIAWAPLNGDRLRA